MAFTKVFVCGGGILCRVVGAPSTQEYRDWIVVFTKVCGGLGCGG